MKYSGEPILHLKMIIEFLDESVKLFDNQTDTFRDPGLIINPLDNQPIRDVWLIIKVSYRSMGALPIDRSTGLWVGFP